MQDILRRDGLLPDAALGKREILRDRGIEMVAHHQHVEMFVDGVAGEWPCRIGRRRQHILQARDLDDVGGVPAAGVVPQSSCSLSEQAPALTISSSAAGREALPLPAKPRFTGRPSAAWIMRPMCQGPGVQVVAKVPCAGPVPPPSMEVMPDINASSTCCGQMK